MTMMEKAEQIDEQSLHTHPVTSTALSNLASLSFNYNSHPHTIAQRTLLRLLFSPEIQHITKNLRQKRQNKSLLRPLPPQLQDGAVFNNKRLILEVVKKN
jgi:hypothetical protein